MRMKEVCEKTGLTDRAVRLYIDSGLLSPASESSYTGRRSLDFAEKDLTALDAIATLRKADFSIADIRSMQESPERIPSILRAQMEKMEREAEAKKRILQDLERIPHECVPDYLAVASELRRSASVHTLPKEDSAMSQTDLNRAITRRIFPFFSLLFLFFSLVTLTPIAIRAVFADAQVLAGGGYHLKYLFTAERFADGLPLLAALLLLAAAFVAMLIHLIRIKRPLMVASTLCLAAAVVLLVLLPSELRNALYAFEFLYYRYSILFHLYWSVDDVFDLFLMSLKFIPIVFSSVFALCAILTERRSD
ncbi:MAG: MerR family transcriptional regulator [Ruminococcaceae bacterium]|nr:MerR family transcriptional regulator [Oscillospiraceae bacterium]